MIGHTHVLTLEDGVLDGGYGEKVARFYGDSDMKVICRGIAKKFLDEYDKSELLSECRMTPDLIIEDVENMLK